MDYKDQDQIMKTLKLILKKKKVKYNDLSLALNLSESSIKRLMSGSDFRISFLIKICEIIDLTIFDLIETAKRSESEFYRLTHEQEILFANEPLVYAIFIELYSGKSLRTVKEIWNLNETELFKVLRKLEKLNLIEIYPRTRIRFKIRGRISWQKNGPLFKKLFKRQNEDFLSNVYQNLGKELVLFQSSELKMTNSTYEKMLNAIKEITLKYRTLAHQEEKTLPDTSLNSFRWIFASSPFSTNWKSYENS